MHIYYELPGQDGSGDSIYIDASVHETHSASSTVTRLPVERGVDASDHSRPEPVSLQIQGVISDHPSIGALDAAGTPGKSTSQDLQDGSRVTAYQYRDGSKRSLVEYQRLLNLKDNAYLCDMSTSLKLYTSMVVESIEVVRTADTGNAVHFTMSAIQIRVIDSQTVPIRRPKQRRGQKKVNAGKVAPKEEPRTPVEEEKSQSLLTKLFGHGKRAT